MAAIAVAGLAPAAPLALTGTAGAKVKARLIADVSSMKAGEPFTVAVVLAMQPGWHIYWKNPGDAGLATKLQFNAPAGFKVEPADYPLPVKFDQAGDIKAYGYTGTVVFLARVTPPKKLVAGTAATLAVDGSWLCCSDVCVPGGAKLTLTLPVAEHAVADETNKELFAQAQAAIPAEAPPEKTATVSAAAAPALTDKPAPLALRIDWKQDVTSVEVFPPASSELDLADLKVDDHKRQTAVSMNGRLLAGQTLKTNRLQFLITYVDGTWHRHGFYATMPLAGAPAKTQ
jgi:thiol:disulfide interchange protein DsbD